MNSKKSPHVILKTLGPIFFKSKHVRHHFCPDFQGFAKVFTDFAQIYTDFTHISGDFAQIFTKPKLLGVRLHPHLLHHWCEINEGFLASKLWRKQLTDEKRKVKDDSDGGAHWRMRHENCSDQSFKCFATHKSWDRQPNNFSKFWSSQLIVLNFKAVRGWIFVVTQKQCWLNAYSSTAHQQLYRLVTVTQQR